LLDRVRVKIGISFQDAPNNVVKDSYAYYNSIKGVNLQNSPDVALNNVSIYNTGNFPLTNNMIHTKAIGANDAHALSINNSRSALIQNCTIIGVLGYDCATSPCDSQAWGIYIDPLSSGGTFYNNNITKISAQHAAYGLQMAPVLNLALIESRGSNATNCISSYTYTNGTSKVLLSRKNDLTLQVLNNKGDITFNEAFVMSPPQIANAFSSDGSFFAFGPVDSGTDYKVSIRASNIPAQEQIFINTGTEPVQAINFTHSSSIAYILTVAYGNNVGFYEFDTPSPTPYHWKTISKFDKATSVDSYKNYSRGSIHFASAFGATTVFNIIGPIGNPFVQEFTYTLNALSNSVLQWYPTQSDAPFYLAVGGSSSSGDNNLYLLKITTNSLGTITGATPIFQTKILDTVTACKWSTDGSHLAVTACNGITSELHIYTRDNLFKNSNVATTKKLSFISCSPTFAWTFDNKKLITGANYDKAQSETYSALHFAQECLVQTGVIDNISNKNETPLAIALHANLSTYAASNTSLRTNTPYIGIANVSTQENANAFSNVY